MHQLDQVHALLYVEQSVNVCVQREQIGGNGQQKDRDLTINHQVDNTHIHVYVNVNVNHKFI